MKLIVVAGLARRLLLPAALLALILLPSSGATAAGLETSDLAIGSVSEASVVTAASPPNRESMVRFVNLSSTDEAKLALHYVNSDGTTAAQEPLITLKPNTQAGAATLVSVKGNGTLKSPFYGSGVIRSDQPVGSLHMRRSRVSPGTEYYAGDIGPTQPATRLFIPMVYSGYRFSGGPSGTFNSRINVQNPQEDSIACVWFSFWDTSNKARLADGLSPKPDATNCPNGGYRVPPGGSLERDLSTMTSQLKAPYVGSVMVLSYANRFGRVVPVGADVEVWSADRYSSYPAPMLLSTTNDADDMHTSVVLPLVYKRYGDWNSYIHIQNSNWSRNPTLRLVFRGPAIPGGVAVFKTTLERLRAMDLSTLDDGRLPPNFVGSLTIENTNTSDTITAVAFNSYTLRGYTSHTVYAAQPTDSATNRVIMPLVYNNRGGTTSTNGWNTRIAVQTLDGTTDYFNLAALPETCCSAHTTAFGTSSSGFRSFSVRGTSFNPANLPNNFIGSGQLASLTDRPFAAVIIQENNAFQGDWWFAHRPILTSGQPPADVATFYDYGSGAARIHAWLSGGSSFQYQGAGGWWSIASGYSLPNVGDRMVTGDFNGDGKEDVAVFYDYGSSTARIHVWLSNGSSFQYQGSGGWWSIASGYSLANVAGRMVAGDFNGDGKDDIAVLYDYGANGARIHVWLSNGSSFQYQGAGGWWSVDSGYSPSRIADRMVAGDFNGDGKDDIATFYDYGSSASRVHVWLSTGSSFSYQGPSGWWGVDSGYSLSNIANRMVTGDFDGDGKDDIATFYDYGSGAARVHIWLSTGSSLNYRGSGGWWRIDSGYTLGRVGARMAAADFTGDGKDDIATFYDYTAGASRIHAWLSTGSSLQYQGPSGWWSVDSGYSLPNVGGRMIAGDFNGP